MDLFAKITQLVRHRRHHVSRRHLLLFRFMALLIFLTLLWTAMFQVAMEYEGRQYSWIAGLHWTLKVMATHGPDIWFQSDLGRLFSIVVMLSGVVTVFIMMPFIFIAFFYEPWMKAQSAARASWQLPEQTQGHVILSHHDAVSTTLIKQLTQYQRGYVLLVPELDEALRLDDLGLQVVVGKLSDPETYRKARVKQAALVAATSNDQENTFVASTVRELSDSIPIIATANSAAAVEVLKLAGATHVLELAERMGQSLVRRTNGGDAMAHVIGQFDELQIAEATSASIMVGKTLGELKLREKLAVSVLGVWDRGQFASADAQTRITQNTVLVLAGTPPSLAKYDETYCIYNVPLGPVVIVGGGRVGQAAARALAARELDYRVIERRAERIHNEEKYILGNASDLKTLERAGIMEAPAVLITTHDAATNIYLTIFLRKLRPDLQIISRGGWEGDAQALHRAGCDFVMSYPSMGANVIFNILTRGDILMLAEGLDLFRIVVPELLVGRTIVEAGIREKTGCTVIAIDDGKKTTTLPDPTLPLQKNTEMILIGSAEAETRFLERYEGSHSGT